MLIKLIDTSISASWLILAVIALRMVCKKIPKAMICLLWGLVAIRLICPFSIKSPLSLIPNTEPIMESIVSAAVLPSSPPSVLEIEEAPAPSISLNQEVEAAESSAPDAHLYATAIWMIGMLALLGYAAASYFRLRRTVSASIRVKGNIWICDGVDSPFILGIVRPQIYLPSSMDNEQFSYVLAHENAHLKRRDHWWKPLGFVLLSIYWFHPLVWAAYILLCRDIELACDERVIRDMGMWEKKMYSEILLSCSTAVASVCPVAFGGVGVKERVKSVLHYKKPAMQSIVAAGIIGAVMAVCFLTDPTQGLAAEDEEAVPSPTPIVHTLTGEDVAAMNADSPEQTAVISGEKDLAAMLAEEWTSSGYTALTYEEYEAQYTYALVSLANAPVGYKNIGYVFVRPDSGMPERTMIAQVLYSYDQQAAIIVQQEDSDASGSPVYYYSDSDEMGKSLGDSYWFSYRAGYDGAVDGTYINMMLRSAQDLGAKNCWLMLRSLWPEG